MQRKCNLVLHAGAHAVNRDAVFGVPTPERTESWVPVSHSGLVNAVLSTLEAEAGLTIVSEAHGLTRDGLRYFGLFQVANGHNNDEYGLVVGIRNSHDKSYPAGLVLGSSVFVCDNLSFSGQVKLARKHTTHIERDLPKLVSRAVGLLTDLRGLQQRRFEVYHNEPLDNAKAHDLIVRAVRKGALPSSLVMAVADQWVKPQHPEFEPRTAWSLFNAFTEVLKGSLAALPSRTQALHGLFDSQFMLDEVIDSDVVVS